MLVLTPILPSGGTLPYYHPTVTHLAFRIILPTSSESVVLRIEALPLPGTPLDPGARLYRTCLSLLETLHRYGWGALTHYKKRVLHDILVPRETYQDLYLIMRERHKYLVDEWHEVTDPLKHVFEVRRHACLPYHSHILLNAARSGHRHSDVPHTSLERHVQPRDRACRLSRRHELQRALAPLAASSRRLRRPGMR